MEKAPIRQRPPPQPGADKATAAESAAPLLPTPPGKRLHDKTSHTRAGRVSRVVAILLSLAAAAALTMMALSGASQDQDSHLATGTLAPTPSVSNSPGGASAGEKHNADVPTTKPTAANNQDIALAKEFVYGDDTDPSPAETRRSQLQNRIRDGWGSVCGGGSAGKGSVQCKPAASALGARLSEFDSRRRSGELPIQQALASLRAKGRGTDAAVRYQVYFLELLMREAGEDLAAGMFDPAALPSMTADWVELSTAKGARREAAYLNDVVGEDVDGGDAWDAYQKWRWGSSLSVIPRNSKNIIYRHLTNFTSAAEVLYEGKRLVAAGLGRIFLDSEMAALHNLVFSGTMRDEARRALATQTFEDVMKRIFNNYASQVHLVVELARMMTEREKASGIAKVKLDMNELARSGEPGVTLDSALRCPLLQHDPLAYGDRHRPNVRISDSEPNGAYLRASARYGGRSHGMNPNRYMEVPHALFLRILADLDLSAIPPSGQDAAEDSRTAFCTRANDVLYQYLTWSMLKAADDDGVGARLCAASDNERIERGVRDVVASPLWMPQNWARWLESTTLYPTNYMTPTVSCSSLSRTDDNPESARYICNLEYLLYASPNMEAWFSGADEDLFVQKPQEQNAPQPPFAGHRVVGIGSENTFSWEMNLMEVFNLYRPPRVAQALHRRSKTDPGSSRSLEEFAPAVSWSASPVPAHNLRMVNVFDCSLMSYVPWTALYKDGGLGWTDYSCLRSGKDAPSHVEVPPSLYMHNISFGLAAVCGTGVTGVFNVDIPGRGRRLFVSMVDMKDYMDTSCGKAPRAAKTDMYEKYPPVYVPDRAENASIGGLPLNSPTACAFAPSTARTDVEDGSSALPRVFDDISLFKYDTESDEFRITDSWYAHELMTLHATSPDMRSMVEKISTRPRDRALTEAERSVFLTPLPLRRLLDKSFNTLSLILHEFHHSTPRSFARMMTSSDFAVGPRNSNARRRGPAFVGAASAMHTMASIMHHFLLFPNLGIIGLSTEQNPVAVHCCGEYTHTHYSYFMRSELWMTLKRYQEGKEDVRVASARVAALRAGGEGQGSWRSAREAHVMAAYKAFVLETAASTVGPLWVEALYDEGVAKRFHSAPKEFTMNLRKPTEELYPDSVAVTTRKLRGFYSSAMWSLLHDEELAAMFAHLGLADSGSEQTDNALLVRQRTAFIGAVRKVIRAYATALRTSYEPLVQRLYRELGKTSDQLSVWEEDVGFCSPKTRTRSGESVYSLQRTPPAALATWGRNATSNYGDEFLKLLVSVRAEDTTESIERRVRALLTTLDDDGNYEKTANDAGKEASETARRLPQRPLRLVMDPTALGAMGSLRTDRPRYSGLPFFFMQLMQCTQLTPLGDTTTFCNPEYAFAAPAEVSAWLASPSRSASSGRSEFPHAVLTVRDGASAASLVNRPALERMFSLYKDFASRRRVQQQGRGSAAANSLQSVRELSLDPTSISAEQARADGAGGGGGFASVVGDSIRETEAYTRVRKSGSGELPLGSSFDAALLVNLDPVALQSAVPLTWLYKEVQRAVEYESARGRGSDGFASTFPRASHVTFFLELRGNSPWYMSDAALPFYTMGYLPTSVHTSQLSHQKVDFVHYRYFVKSEVWSFAHAE